MAEDDFRRNLALGRRWEVAVAAWLKSRGWFLMPDYASLNTDGAPKMAGSQGTMVLPDLLGADHGAMKWVEVKYRTRVVHFRRLDQMVTGKIEERLWNEYLQVEAKTGIPVWLVFVQKNAAEVMGAPIRHLARHCHRGIGDGAGFVNVDYESLERLASIEDITRFAPALSTSTPTFSRDDMAKKIARLLGTEDDDDRAEKWVHCMARGAASEEDARAVVTIARQISGIHGPRCVCATCFDAKLARTR